MIQRNTPFMEKAGAKVPGWYHNLDPDKYGTATEFLTLLAGKGVDFNKTDRIGFSPLQLALSRDTSVTSDLIMGFVANGANVQEELKRRGSVIVQAAGVASPEVMAAIVAKGADVNREDQVADRTENWKGFTPLVNAVKMNNLPTVTYLVGKGAKTNVKVEGIGTVYSHRSKTFCQGNEVKNKSLLYFAIETGNKDLVQFLVDSAKVKPGDAETMEYKEQRGMTHQNSASDMGNRCFSFGSFNPKSYANRLGLPEIEKFLNER